VDLAPTFLTLLGLSIPPSVQGRVLDEAFTERAARPGKQAAVASVQHSADTRDGRYRVTATLSIVRIDGREYRYFDAATVTRR
jgi:arylsulfatase A-like enzyme